MQLIESVKECMDAVMKRQGECTVKAVGITNERETTVVWNSTNGEPLCNAISEEG